jgi:hypothetical protein
MKRASILLSALISFFVSGCESGSVVPSRMRERFQPAQPKTQIFQGEQPAVFEAARAALRRLDFQTTRAGAAQGLLNAHSRLQASDAFGKARQYVIEVRVRALEPGSTEVSAVLREQEESSSFAGATDLVLKEHGLYTSFFAAVEQVLRQQNNPDPAP